MTENTPRTAKYLKNYPTGDMAKDFHLAIAWAEQLETELLVAQERIRELEAEIGILKMGFVPQKD
jgi:hypothetical protein